MVFSFTFSPVRISFDLDGKKITKDDFLLTKKYVQGILASIIK